MRGGTLIAAAAWLAVSACAPRRQTEVYLPVAVWGEERVQVGEQVVAAPQVGREPALPTSTGALRVEVLETPEGSGLSGAELIVALRQWLEEHDAEVRERMGDACAGRERCLQIVASGEAPPPEGVDYVVSGAFVQYDPYAEAGTIRVQLQIRSREGEGEPVEAPLTGSTLDQVAAHFFGMVLPSLDVPGSVEPVYETRPSAIVTDVQRRRVTVWE